MENIDQQSIQAHEFNSGIINNQNNQDNECFNYTIHMNNQDKKDKYYFNNNQSPNSVSNYKLDKYKDLNSTMYTQNSSQEDQQKSGEESLNSTYLLENKSVIIEGPNKYFRFAQLQENVQINKKESDLISQNQFIQQYVDEELQFIIDNFDFHPEFAEEILLDYFYNRNIFISLILIQFIIQLYIMSLSIADRYIIINYVINQITIQFTDLYKYDIDSVQIFFYSILITDSIVNFISLFFALKAYARHQIQYFKRFSNLYTVCITSRIILAYINTWNVIMFILMLFAYTYSRYMIALIYGLCLIPANQNNNFYSNNDYSQQNYSSTASQLTYTRLSRQSSLTTQTLIEIDD